MPARGSHREPWLEIVCFLLGFFAIAFALVSWRVPPGTPATGADLTLVSTLTGELDVSPTGVFVRHPNLKPSARVSGVLRVRNQTGRTLMVRLRAPSEARQVDAFLRIAATAGGVPLFRGPLGELRSWTRNAFRLASGETRSVRVRAWLPPTSASGFEGRTDRVTIEFRGTPERERSAR